MTETQPGNELNEVLQLLELHELGQPVAPLLSLDLSGAMIISHGVFYLPVLVRKDHLVYFGGENLCYKSMLTTIP